MEITKTSMTSPIALSVVHLGVAPAGTSGLGYEAVRVLAPRPAATQGTTVSIAMRERSVAPVQVAASPKATALLPISDVVVFNGLAGIRSTWSPPV
ncbi:MAG TPA: hypothetical protein VF423_01000 [Actinomycetes bacterium]|jgi:hypothetical protein